MTNYGDAQQYVGLSEVRFTGALSEDGKSATVSAEPVK